jgi:hypothetical protein
VSSIVVLSEDPLNILFISRKFYSFHIKEISRK